MLYIQARLPVKFIVKSSLKASGMYKPASKKVGTLYKLWIKKECNNLQIS